MNKKVLALVLVFVVAFAGSAMAKVEFGGKFTTTIKQDSVKAFLESYSVTSSLAFNMSASPNKGTGWSLAAELTSGGLANKYKLTLNDEYFNAVVWRGQNHTHKRTNFDFVFAKRAAGSKNRVRVDFPVMDLATVTFDLETPDNIRLFVDTKIDNVDVGVAYARKDWSKEDKAQNVIAVDASTKVNAGGLNVAIDGAAGVSIADAGDFGYALGLGAETNFTKELKVSSSVVAANSNWAGDAGKPSYAVVKADVGYTETEFQAGVKTEYAYAPNHDNESKVELYADYRMSTALSYANLFHNNHWFKNTAPAFGANVKFAGGNLPTSFDVARVEATTPILDNMIWGKAYGEFKSTDDFGAGIEGYITPINKLSIRPSVDYKYTNTEFDVKVITKYLIGSTDASVTFTAQKVFNEGKNGKELLEAKLEIPF